MKPWPELVQGEFIEAVNTGEQCRLDPYECLRADYAGSFPAPLPEVVALIPASVALLQLHATASGFRDAFFFEGGGCFGACFSFLFFPGAGGGRIP